MGTIAGRTPGRWATAALGFAVGYGALRWYWAAGGRWGYTACDRTRAPDRAEAATGCGAEHVLALSFWSGWGAVALCAVLAAVAVAVVVGARRPGPGPGPVSVATWVACAVLVVLSFPAHLVVELPAAVLGAPTDLRDLGHRLLQLGGGLLFGAAAAARSSRCGHPRATGPRPVPARLRGWAYAACAVPVLGFTVPHALWLAGVPLGIPAEVLDEIAREFTPAAGAAVTLAPALGGLLTLGLARPWGQTFPRWAAGQAGRPVPRLLALVPAGVVAVALVAYGLIGVWIIGAALATGRSTWSELAAGWAVAGTELVFLGWGVALGAAALAYERLTRPRCPVCDPAPVRAPEVTGGAPARS